MKTDVLTIREAVKRAKAEGLPVSQSALRQWVKSGEIPHRKAGNRYLIFFPNLVAYLKCEDAQDQQPAKVTAPGIRRIEI